MEVYLDNSATTRVFPEAAELMKQIMCEDYGNPSSLHKLFSPLGERSLTIWR